MTADARPIEITAAAPARWNPALDGVVVELGDHLQALVTGWSPLLNVHVRRRSPNVFLDTRSRRLVSGDGEYGVLSFDMPMAEDPATACRRNPGEMAERVADAVRTFSAERRPRCARGGLARLVGLLGGLAALDGTRGAPGVSELIVHAAMPGAEARCTAFDPCREPIRALARAVMAHAAPSGWRLTSSLGGLYRPEVASIRVPITDFGSAHARLRFIAGLRTHMARMAADGTPTPPLDALDRLAS